MRYLPMLFAPVLIMSTVTAAFSKDEATAQCESPTAMKLYDKGIFVAMINTRSMTMNGKEVTRESVSRMDSAEKDAMEQLAKATDAAILAYRSGLNLYEAKRDVNGELQLSPGLVAVSNLVQVQREILAADMVELADNGPLYNCPKALDRVRVRRAINGSEEIALGIDSRVVDAAMCHELVKPIVERTDRRNPVDQGKASVLKSSVA